MPSRLAHPRTRSPYNLRLWRRGRPRFPLDPLFVVYEQQPGEPRRSTDHCFITLKQAKRYAKFLMTRDDNTKTFVSRISTRARRRLLQRDTRPH